MSEHTKRTLALLALMLSAAALFRFYGLWFGLPFETHVDESFIVRPVLDMYREGHLRPFGFFYPSLVYYVLLVAAYLLSLFKEPTVYDLYIVGRVVSAVFSTVTVCLVFLIGRRAYNTATGLLAAAFFACTVTAFRESHYYTTDALNTFFITLALYFIVRVALGDPFRNYIYAGLATGLAAGTKYNGAFLVVPLIVAHLARASEVNGRGNFAHRLKNLGRQLFSPWLLAAGLISLLAFVATTPYVVIEPSTFLKELGKSSSALSREIVEGNHHYIGTTPYWYYVETLLFWAMNPLLEVACLAGLFYALARRRRPDVVIALWVFIYFAVVGGWLNKVTRYTLPLLPPLSLFGARMFVELTNDLRARGRRVLSHVVAATAALVLASALLYSLAYTSIYARPHTGLQTIRWLNANAPAGSTILLEEPTPQERPQPDGARMARREGVPELVPQRFRFKYLYVPKVSRKDLDAAAQRAELEAALEGVDYIVMSTRWYEGLVASPEASEVIKEYYRSLNEPSGRFELVAEITSRPRLFGIEINDDRSELNFRIFDHPKVWIFRRRRGA